MCNSQQGPLHNPKLEFKKNISLALEVNKSETSSPKFLQKKKKKKSRPSHWLQQVHQMQNKSEQPLFDSEF